MTAYFDALCEAMALLSRQSRAIFMGQSVRFPGTAMFNTLRDVPMEQRLEMPVAENMQLGMATGMALDGMLPVCMYPRINFLLEATSQLVQHLDKLPLYSDGGYKPKVIIRTGVATAKPLNPGEQHIGNYTAPLATMLSTVNVIELHYANQIVPAYRHALEADESSLMVEYLGKYYE